MREGKTLTRTMQIESRQHELFNLDLGEGAPRAALVAGFILIVSWFGLLTLILGPPQRATFMVYLLPPAVLTVFGWRESQRTPRRRRITDWALTARWILRGHEPVIGLGRTSTSGHTKPLSKRAGERLGAAGRGDGPSRHLLEVPLPAVTTGGRVHLVGTAAAEQIVERQRAKKRLPKIGRTTT